MATSLTKQILDSINDLNEKMGKVLNVCETVEELNETIHGNGGEGLKTTVAKHEVFISEAKDAKKEGRSNTWALVLLGLGTLLNLGLTVFTK